MRASWRWPVKKHQRFTFGVLWLNLPISHSMHIAASDWTYWNTAVGTRAVNMDRGGGDVTRGKENKGGPKNGRNSYRLFWGLRWTRWAPFHTHYLALFGAALRHMSDSLSVRIQGVWGRRVSPLALGNRTRRFICLKRTKGHVVTPPPHAPLVSYGVHHAAINGVHRWRLMMFVGFVEGFVEGVGARMRVQYRQMQG